MKTAAIGSNSFILALTFFATTPFLNPAIAEANGFADANDVLAFYGEEATLLESGLVVVEQPDGSKTYGFGQEGQEFALQRIEELIDSIPSVKKLTDDELSHLETLLTAHDTISESLKNRDRKSNGGPSLMDSNSDTGTICGGAINYDLDTVAWAAGAWGVNAHASARVRSFEGTISPPAPFPHQVYTLTAASYTYSFSGNPTTTVSQNDSFTEPNGPYDETVGPVAVSISFAAAQCLKSNALALVQNNTCAAYGYGAFAVVESEFVRFSNCP